MAYSQLGNDVTSDAAYSQLGNDVTSDAAYSQLGANHVSPSASFSNIGLSPSIQSLTNIAPSRSRQSVETCSNDGQSDSSFGSIPSLENDTEQGPSENIGIEDESVETQIEKKLEVGSLLESLDQVYILYCEYARCTGFSVKKGTQGYFRGSKYTFNMCEDESNIRMKVYQCSCEGLPDKKRSIDAIPKYKKQVTRTDCKARLRVVRKRGCPWVVSVFHKDHNHELLNAEQSYLLRSSRNLSYAKQYIIEAMHASGITLGHVYRFMEKESGGPQNVGFIRQDLYAHMNRLKRSTRLDNSDAKALLKHFIEKSNNEQFFKWKVELDDDGRIMNLFMRDGRCAIDYEFFGDVMCVDTTFRTNRYNLICAPFVGVNHHGQNIMFAIAFLSDERTETFKWLFEAFLETMDRREPQVIFTDQCQALINGIDYTFHAARHRLCQWHINQNAPRHFGKLNSNKEFKNVWHRLMNKCDTEDEFEQLWADMISTYNLADKRWFSTMYRLRKRWADVFTNQLFSAGMHATSRSEVTNKVIKDLCASSCSLHEFVLSYESLQTEWRRRESEEDAKCRGMPGQIVEKNNLLTHAATILTRNVYKLFEKQATYSINIRILTYPTDISLDEVRFEVSSTTNPERIRIVTVNKATGFVNCSCHLWDVKGVICYHMFRIFYLLDYSEIPDCLIMRRWTRDAKLRHRFCNGTGLSTHESDLIPGMSFVNKVMRKSYGIAQKYMVDSESQNIIDQRLNELDEELVRNEKKKNRKRPNGGNVTQETYNGEEWMDPLAAKHRTFPAKRCKPMKTGYGGNKRGNGTTNKEKKSKAQTRV